MLLVLVSVPAVARGFDVKGQLTTLRIETNRRNLSVGSRSIAGRVVSSNFRRSLYCCNLSVGVALNVREIQHQYVCGAKKQ